MDPLTALGLASNILSFTQFASELIRATKEIYNSANGSSVEINSLESIYGRLRSLSDGLKSCSAPEMVPDTSPEIDDMVSSLRDISQTCESDCDRLLNITAKLKTGSDASSRWNSFRVALRKAWAQSKITELEDRLNKTQVTLNMHICTITSYHLLSHSSEVRKLQRQSLMLHADQNAQLHTITQSLSSLQARLRTAEVCPERHAFTIADLDSIDQQLKQMSLAEKTLANEQSVLQSLTFESRPVRHEAVPIAHRETFSWALETSVEGVQDSVAEAHHGKLANWLQSGHGIFWVTGKPGSGKSTLMKFVADEPRTYALVSDWASPRPAVIVGHYFWNAGTSMQKSYQGLLQSLLYDILRQCPQLIPVVCSDRMSKPASSSPPWTVSSLRKTLESVASGDLDNARFCIFIDGLDEYEGAHSELCQILKDLARSNCVKLCLSSRPWNVFDEAFGHDIPRLHVHELTREDIRKYSASRLQEHPRWTSVTTPEQGEWLISEISARAWGVFLWAFLVTKLLQEGLTNRDRFSDICRRLECFPLELEPFFMAMLDSVQPFYHSKMSTALQIAVVAREPLHFLIYDFHDQEYDNPDYAVSMPVQPLVGSQVNEIKQVTIARLESRTKGLLELHAGSSNVTFLHRTVKDFLNTSHISNYLNAKIIPELHFNAGLSILKAHLAWVKSLEVERVASVQRHNFGDFSFYSAQGNRRIAITPSSIAQMALPYAAYLDAESFPGYDEALAVIIDNMDEITADLVASAGGLKNQMQPRVIFRESLVASGMFNFLQRKVVGVDRLYLAGVGSGLTVALVSTDLEVAKRYGHVSQQGIEILRHTVEANLVKTNVPDRDGVTPWAALLSYVTSKQAGLPVDTLFYSSNY